MSEAPALSVRITGGRVVARAQDGNSLSGLVAIVDVRVGPFVLSGCRLWRRRDLKMVLSLPEMERTDGQNQGIRIEDLDLKAEMTAAACAMAKMMGGNVDPIEPDEPAD